MSWNWEYKGYGINGNFHKIKSQHFQDVSPFDLKKVNTIWGEEPALVDEAVSAAKNAQSKWFKLSLEERTKKFLSFAAEVEKRSEEIAQAICNSTGKTITECRGELKAVARKNKLTVEKGLDLVKTVYASGGEYQFHPLGVISIVGPFNFPVHLINSHVAPALLLGNTVVIKGSENCPAVSQLYYEASLSSELPPGAINIVQGGPIIGDKLVSHPDVFGVVFTGSYRVGKKIKESCLNSPNKLLALEMGGKNFCVIDEDADIELAAKEISAAVLGGAGQKCSATSRVLAHKKLADKLLGQIKIQFEAVTQVDPRKDNSKMGTLVNDQAARSFLAYQESIKTTNSEIILEGNRPDDSSCFVRPALRKVYDSKDPIFFEEVFGPDLSFETFSDYDSVFPTLNDNPYGLCLSFFGQSKTKNP